ncbi:MAG: ribosome-associated translation inhibitor RaiA [Nitrospinae bacterium]|nr:ribosome-associated translation inhibitor RaiA [Nitrospinota bacterium]
MKLTVTGRNIEITDGIREHLQNKMDKTIPGMGEEADIHVALSVEKHRHFAEVTVKTKGFSVHSKEETDDLYASMDNALIKIEKQLRKHKEKAQALRNKKGSKSKENIQG